VGAVLIAVDLRDGFRSVYDLIRSQEDRRRNAQRLRDLKIGHELELGRLLYRQGGGGLDAQVLDQQHPAGARDRLQEARSLPVELGTQQMDNAVQRGQAGRDARANMKPMAFVQCTSRADRGRPIMFAVTDTR
jgi:hypothetical protein